MTYIYLTQNSKNLLVTDKNHLFNFYLHYIITSPLRNSFSEYGDLLSKSLIASM